MSAPLVAIVEQAERDKTLAAMISLVRVLVADIKSSKIIFLPPQEWLSLPHETGAAKSFCGFHLCC